MNRLARRAAMALVMTLASLAAVRADGVLDQVPPDAMGFAVVRNLANTNDRIQQVMKIFEKVSEVHPPAPLTFIKAATGIGEGVNDSGDALIALLPGDAEPMEPKPLLLVPVSDYAKFAESINGDASGEICRVTIAGEEVLVAKRGEFAMLMNVEHRPRMEALLAGSTTPPSTVAQLTSWIGKNEFAVVVLPAGVDALTAAGQAGLASQRVEMENQFSDPQFAEMMADIKRGLELYDSILGFCNAEIGAAAIGVSIDESANIRISDRIVFEKDGQLAKIENVPKLDRSPLIGFAAGPFVYAGGGPLPPAWAELMSKMTRKAMEQYPEQFGFKEFDEAKWAQVEASWKAVMVGLRSISMGMLPGEKDDAVCSNIFGIMKVDDAAAYLASSKKSTELWNELVAASTSDIKLPYEISDVEIAGKKGVLMTSDVAAAAADDNVPMVKPLLQSLFGSDGKMRVYTIAADDKTIVFGVGTEEQIAKAIGRATSADAGLSQAPDVQTTAALLDQAAPWSAYLSPQGFVMWLKRIFSAFADTLGGLGSAIPDYPAGPPLGFSMNLTSGQFHGEIVVPAKSLEGLADYIKACEGL